MNDDEIIAALEASAPLPRGQEFIDVERTASIADIRHWRDRLMRFMEELDAGISVGEIRNALEDYA